MIVNLLNFKLFLTFLFIFFINFFVISFRNKIAKYLNILDYPNKRKIHKTPTPLVGGICLFITVFISTFIIYFEGLISQNKFIIFISLYIIFFIVGLWDDSQSLSAKTRSIILILSLIILIPILDDLVIKELNFRSTDIIIDLEVFAYLFTFFCIFSLYNALNFIDGYNGSAISIIIFWTIILFIKNPNLVYLILIFNLILIFIYNLSGKIFLGNSGTSFISVFFAISFIDDYNNSKLYADEIFLLLLFPGLDMIRVTTERFLNKKKIYYPDKTHFHHYLIKYKSNFVWHIMLILTILPLFLFLLIKNIIFTIVINIVLYFIIYISLKQKNDPVK